MYLLYIDESYKNKKYLLGAVFLVDSKIRKLNHDFEIFWKKIGFNLDIELHAENLWNAHGDYEGMDMNKRAEISKEIAEWLSKTTITKFYAGHIAAETKKECDDSYVNILEKAINKAVKYVHTYAPQSSKQLLIIFDERKDIKSEIQNQIREKHHEVIKKHKSACYIIDYGYQGDSKYSRVLQIADFIGYFINKQLNINRENDDQRMIDVVDFIVDKLNKKLEIIK